MSTHNLGTELKGAFTTVAKTTTAALTYAEITDGIPLISCTTAGGAFVVTLPAASDEYAGRLVFLCVYGHQTNAVTVNVVAGYGGDSDIDDSVVAPGEIAMFYSDGTYWYANGSTIPEA